MGFDLQYTKMSPLGTTGSFGPTQVPTGRREIASNVAALGKGLSDLGVQLHRLQAQNQLDESTAKLQEEFDRLEDRIERTGDSEQYDQFFKETMELARSFTPKNSMAKRAYSNVLRKAEISGRDYLMGQKLEVERDKKRALVAAKIAEGNYDGARAGVVSGIQLGAFKREDLPKIEKQIQKQQAMNKAFSSNPDEILKYRSYQDMKKDYPLLSSGDYNDLRISAEGHKNFLKRQKENWQIAFSQSVYDTALSIEKGEKSLQDGLLEIRNKPGLSPSDIAHFSSMLKKAVSDMNGGKGNPYTTTQDWPAFVKVARKLEEDPNSVPLDVIRYGTAKYWTWSQEQYLIGLKDPTRQDPHLKLPFWQLWDTTFDNLYLDDDDQIKKDKMVEWAQVKGTAREIYLENPDPKVAQEKLQRYYEYVDEQHGNGFLSNFLSGITQTMSIGAAPFMKEK